MTKRNRKSADARSGEIFYIDPAQVYIPGHDPEFSADPNGQWDASDSGSNPLCDVDSNRLEVEERTVESFRVKRRNIQPIGLRKITVPSDHPWAYLGKSGERNGYMFTIVWGRHRVRASRIVNEELPAAERFQLTSIVCPRGMTEQDMVSDMVVENAARRSVPIKKLRAQVSKLSAAGHNMASIAAMLSVSAATVTNAAKINELPVEVASAVDDGAIPVTSGYALSSELPSVAKAVAAEVQADAAKTGSRVTTAAVDAKLAEVTGVKQKTKAPTKKRIKNLFVELRDELAYKPSDELLGAIAALRWVLGETEMLELEAATREEMVMDDPRDRAVAVDLPGLVSDPDYPRELAGQDDPPNEVSDLADYVETLDLSHLAPRQSGYERAAE